MEAATFKGRAASRLGGYERTSNRLTTQAGLGLERHAIVGGVGALPGGRWAWISRVNASICFVSWLRDALLQERVVARKLLKNPLTTNRCWRWGRAGETGPQH